MNLLTLKTARRGFTLVELLVVIAIIAVLIGTLLPAVQSAREAARRTGCSFNIRGLAQAIMVYESTKKRLPAATDRNEALSKAGDNTATTTRTGYSWIFHLLPYIEEGNFYNNVVGNTNKLQFGPFDNVTRSGENAKDASGNTTTPVGPHAATTPISQLICPSFGGGGKVATTASLSTSGLSYANPSEYPMLTDRDVALTNYMAMAGTHMETVGSSIMPIGGAIQLKPDQVAPASMLLTPWLASRSGITAGSVSDGQSKTVFIAESNEQGYAAWIDGTATWVVAYPPELPVPIGSTGTWYSSGTTAVDKSALNMGTKNPAKYYMSALQFSGRIKNPRYQGPASDHQGGVTMHVFGDTHVSQITNDIDPTVYLSICSKSGKESTSQVD